MPIDPAEELTEIELRKTAVGYRTDNVVVTRQDDDHWRWKLRCIHCHPDPEKKTAVAHTLPNVRRQIALHLHHHHGGKAPA
jgi:hypothetical protein